MRRIVIGALNLSFAPNDSAVRWKIKAVLQALNTPEMKIYPYLRFLCVCLGGV